ncbi:transposase [Salinimonas marina]|uniref:Transposase n=2 Tax=Salinimonas marina TaxID=2785918 RepID=A0A7S9E0H5_9ALTE|nr:transposase [Salinimonas marina]QPG07257.1 transposase [Salinimonas marina]
MPRPRKSLISLSDTPYYHCVSRCVRRAFLCGKDKFTGQSYEHRRQWVEQRLLFLGSVFAINICAYAVMSNHTHVVLHVDKNSAMQWTSEQVLHRWHRLFQGTYLTKRYMHPEERKTLSAAEINTVEATANIYRERLYDISWFMRLLNEYIARQANKEDHCTGRFWEGRFRSQALLDETALAACMAYVDLNPVRAGLANTPEHSPHTSIQRRIQSAKLNQQPRQLRALSHASSEPSANTLPFLLEDYFDLVKQTGRQLKSDQPLQPTSNFFLLKKTGLSPEDWAWLIKNIETQFNNRLSLAAVHKKLKCRCPQVA